MLCYNFEHNKGQLSILNYTGMIQGTSLAPRPKEEEGFGPGNEAE